MPCVVDTAWYCAGTVVGLDAAFASQVVDPEGIADFFSTSDLS